MSPTKNRTTTFSHDSLVEQRFIESSASKEFSTNIPYLCVDNFPKLGLLTSLRFLEWVNQNPTGVISLPTGKTPEFFIKWTQFFLNHWNQTKAIELRKKYGLQLNRKPDLSNLHFVQIDEFYPIHPQQKNSFYDYVVNFYLEGFGMNINKALLINCNEIPLAENKHFNEVFPQHRVDLSLRYRESKTRIEELQQRSIFMIDEWCTNYEKKIRAFGGIGFFLGGIGPDGHIAFNTRGSDFFSTTRLTETNFETQAVAAGDLGGIDVSRNRLVITIGLDTITYNPNTTAIIMAAGESKAPMVKSALECNPSNQHPASSLSKLAGARFYITTGAACLLSEKTKLSFSGTWTADKTDKAIIELCKSTNTYGSNLSIEQLFNDKYCSLIPEVSATTVDESIEHMKSKLNKGLQRETHQRFLHTGPHHDDIMLGLLPFISHHLHDPSNSFNFSVFTSGFNAVTNHYVIQILEELIAYMEHNEIQMLSYPNFFETGYQIKTYKDVYHYLTQVAANNDYQQRRGLCHRVARGITEIFQIETINQLKLTIRQVIDELNEAYDGQKNSTNIQLLKGRIREFEEELVWAHYGIRVENVHHMRLGFYQGDIFTEEPKIERDVLPILEQLKSIQPTVVSLAFDPEGSGPDTHYKTLQALAEALRLWSKETDLSQLRIWGYRNVWHRFQLHEANIIYPISLDEMAAMDEAFSVCYGSQTNAPFPSYEYDGKFSTLTQKIWVRQLKELQLLCGKKFFYENDHPKVRASHGLLLIKEMKLDEFLKHARKLKDSTEGVI